MNQRASKKTESLEIRLAPETKAKIREAADAEGRTVSDLIRQFIDAYPNKRPTFDPRSWCMIGPVSVAAAMVLAVSFDEQAETRVSDVSVEFGGDVNASGRYAFGDTLVFCPSDNSGHSPATQCEDGYGIAFKVEAGEAGSVRLTAHAIEPAEVGAQFLPGDETLLIPYDASREFSVLDASGVLRRFVIEARALRTP